jgi:hypothetical protein
MRTFEIATVDVAVGEILLVALLNDLGARLPYGPAPLRLQACS